MNLTNRIFVFVIYWKEFIFLYDFERVFEYFIG